MDAVNPAVFGGTFEYNVIELGTGDKRRDTVARLNELGAEGWEIVAVTPVDNLKIEPDSALRPRREVWLKRPIPSA